MPDSLVVNEIYLSVQGESSWAGWPCVLVRLTGCPLRCSYCDTAYAFTEGRRMELEQVRAQVHRLAAPFAWWPGGGALHTTDLAAGQCITSPGAGTAAGRAVVPRLPLVELTGGEPLAQPAALNLMQALCDDGFTVLLETSGALDIQAVDARVHRIMDLKCPSSGELERNRWENLAHLRPTDEVKFVIGSIQDYQWAKEQLARHRLAARCVVLFSWAHPLTPNQRHPSLKPPPPGHTPIDRRQLTELILADALPVRFQVQMHKVIWPADQRGV